MKNKIGGILTILLFSTSAVFAHPGRTDSNGCHTCRTNCEKYGLAYGEYHCHDGRSGNTSSSSVNTITVKKSSDTSLKSLKIENKTIDIDEKLEYTTKEENVTIVATATDKNAELDYDREVKLNLGKNEIEIKVTAEDSTTKTYTVTVIREEKQGVLATSENIEEIKEMEVTDEKEDDNITFGDLVVTSGVCGLGYLGYKKYKNNKESKNK